MCGFNTIRTVVHAGTLCLAPIHGQSERETGHGLKERMSVGVVHHHGFLQSCDAEPGLYPDLQLCNQSSTATAQPPYRCCMCELPVSEPIHVHRGKKPADYCRYVCKLTFLP